MMASASGHQGIYERVVDDTEELVKCKLLTCELALYLAHRCRSRGKHFASSPLPRLSGLLHLSGMELTVF